MKKYIVLVILSITIILTVFAVGYTQSKDVVFVKGISPTVKTGIEKLSYSGVVEYAGSAASTAEGSGIVQSVFFKNGDTVEKDDAVIAVCETSADISSILSSGAVDSLSSLLQNDASYKIYKAEKSGKLSGLELSEGGIYFKGQSLFKVSDEKNFQVRLDVSEKDISKIKNEQPVKIDCRAVSRSLTGRVTNISNTARQSDKLTAVRVTVAIDGDNELRSGYTADCSIVTDRKENTLLIPYSSAAVDDEGKYIVYRSAKSGIKKQAVEVGREFSNGLEILSGISESDVIVYNAAAVTAEQKTVISELVRGG